MNKPLCIIFAFVLWGASIAVNAAVILIVPGQIKITTAHLSPTTLKIPTLLPGCVPVPFFDDCGFDSSKSFLLSLGVRNINFNFDMNITSVFWEIFEDDEFFDDSIGSFVQTTGLPTAVNPGNRAVINLGATISAATLNAQCGGGCTNAVGYLAELGSLEFYATATINYALGLFLLSVCSVCSVVIFSRSDLFFSVLKKSL